MSEIDIPRMEHAVREILIAVGEDPDRDGLRGTPARVARAYAEQFAGLRQRPEDVLTKVFDEDHDEMVLVRDIELYATCEHHLLPFIGVAHIGYVPNEKGQITGLSKLARLVDVYARRPQVQERMTSQIADALESFLEPRGVIVVIEAEHLCMSMRGVRKPGARTVTSAVRGVFRDSDRTRAEAMSLVHGSRLRGGPGYGPVTRMAPYSPLALRNDFTCPGRFGGTVTGEGKEMALLNDAVVYSRSGQFGTKAFRAEGSARAAGRP